jgi:hypothetical protein
MKIVLLGAAGFTARDCGIEHAQEIIRTARSAGSVRI